MLNKRPPGKENGIGGGFSAKDELPSAPPNMPAHRRTESASRGYDRYAEPAY